MKVINVVIEIPKLTGNKYEVDKDTGKVKLDRVLYSSMLYPENYGYIDETLAEDNDPLDGFVVSTYQFFPGAIVPGRLIGGIEMIDDGERDTKLIFVTARDPRHDHINELKDLGEHKLKELKEFLENYKNLQKGKVVEVGDFFNSKEANKVFEECKKRYSLQK